VVAKVGRWENEGVLRTHRSGEEGATPADTFLVFEFTNKKGELVETTKYKFVADIAEVADEEDYVLDHLTGRVAEPELPTLVSLRGDAAAEAAKAEVSALEELHEELTEVLAPRTSDIPF
jgi:hypothetical protein